MNGEHLATADAFTAAAALAAGLGSENIDLVLTGLQSDDQGFAQVGVVLAEKLGVVALDDHHGRPGARTRTLRVKRELEGGWFQWIAMPLPAVLTIQSGINQLRYATLKGIMAAKKKEIRAVPAPPAPPARQRITAVYMPEKSKQTRMIGGSPGRGRGRAGARAARRSEGLLMILVVAEQKDGVLNRASWEAVAAAQQLGAPVKIVLPAPRVGAAAAELAAADVAEVIALEHEALGAYTADGFVEALAALVAAEPATSSGVHAHLPDP